MLLQLNFNESMVKKKKKRMRHERLFSSEKLPSPKDSVNNTSQPVMDKTSLNAKSLKGILNIIAVFYICQPYVKNGKNSSSFFF